MPALHHFAASVLADDARPTLLTTDPWPLTPAFGHQDLVILFLLLRQGIILFCRNNAIKGEAPHVVPVGAVLAQVDLAVLADIRQSHGHTLLTATAENP